MNGQLFTDYFLSDGIQATPEWGYLVPEECEAFTESIRELCDRLGSSNQPNEAVTEQELIRPILELLGWADYLPQQGATRNEDIPDFLLFPDASAKAQAIQKASADQRYRDGVVVVESKRLGLSLDSRDKEKGRVSQTPHGQILRYLQTAEVESDGLIRWGILTSGNVWRLYYSRARPRATGYFETDLYAVLKDGDEDALRIFYLLFHRRSFVLSKGAVTTFLRSALADGRRYEEKVAADLSGAVFDRVFPGLVKALADVSGKNLPEVREAALTLLYRLLFILYAEDRGLLPVNEGPYQSYSLRQRIRDDIADKMKTGSVFSSVATNYYADLMTLFRLIDKGDQSLRLPPYNGGLFADEAAPMLETLRLSDATLAPLVYDLSHTNGEGEPRFISYRDMSVQQLGSIYERLLEREPVRNSDGEVEVRPNPYARKDSGSFYTPQELVDLIIDRTLKPLVEERQSAFRQRAIELGKDSRPTSELIPFLCDAAVFTLGGLMDSRFRGNDEWDLCCI